MAHKNTHKNLNDQKLVSYYVHKVHLWNSYITARVHEEYVHTKNFIEVLDYLIFNYNFIINVNT